MPEILRDMESAPSETAGFLASLNQFISTWGKLIIRFIDGNVENALVVVTELEKFCAETAKQFYNSFHLFLQFLYKTEALKDEMVIAWAESRRESDNEHAKHYLALCKQFIDWLQANEEEEEEEEDEEEEEEEETE
eukprot:TRINITY_DN5459_c0_g1_i6.p1 TRINITY_DN5459_c0_g1~~TRINITY_DN5459_c0_g1_i6.p1  ORF type:complete len:136 (+),score=41.31 TRINITY_DN5459_c0_g1_i6:356-763(+)